MRFDPELLRRCWFLTGPTACGKTAVGIELARLIDAEIVSLDSMTLYRRMDIGTAKPTPAERAAGPHHLLDILEPWEEFAVADYLAAAEPICRGLVARGKTPLFVGGTGLYLRSLLRGVFEGPPADWSFRRRMEAESRQHPPDWLHAQVRQVDPATAARLHPSDRRRLIRALEVFEVTGMPLLRQQQEQALPADERPKHVDWLSPPRDWLYERINQRVDQMLAAGLVEEVAALLADPRGLSRTASQALGYKEIIAHLREGAALNESVEQLKARTRQFAKRQHTWFRNLEECREVPMEQNESAEQLAVRLAAADIPPDDGPPR